MCGIAGIWKYDGGVSLREIKDFTDSMIHRGPDGAGYEVFEGDNLAFGHRRLSILDLSEAGKQPMSYADKRYWLTFNGEIYNFIEIRKELLLKGYTFVSDTDSEVLLAAYIAWGKDCFKRFNGMWAVGIWDSQEKELLLCRDRFGVKPLHYCYLPGRLFAFASETLAFKKLENFSRTYHMENLVRAMHAHNQLEPVGETIYTSIKQVLPGSLLVIKKGAEPRQEYWWNTLEHLHTVPQDFEKQKEQFLELFMDACRLRLRSDVPIASALSGGIDSTAVYCMINHVAKQGASQRLPGDWQKAFSISFPGSEVDERKYVESVLRQTGGTGIITAPTNDNLGEELASSTRLSDLISGTPLACLTYVYKSMHEHGITVSMDGHGVDEYIYGYTSSVREALLNSYVQGDAAYTKQLEDTLSGMYFTDRKKINFDALRQEAFAGKTFKQKLKKSMLALLSKNTNNPYYGLPAFSKNSLFKPGEVQATFFKQVNNFTAASKNAGEQQLINEFHYNDLPYNLRDFDRGAMQHQIEIRMPFMDYRLVTYTMSLPQKSKLNAGFTKYILRESMKGIMPEDIRTRKLKIGLGAPIRDWFNGGLNTFLPELVCSTNKDVSFLNWKQIKATVEDRCKHRSWTDNEAQSYWAVINYLLLEL